MNTDGFETKCSESIYAWYSHIGHLVHIQGCRQKDNIGKKKKKKTSRRYVIYCNVVVNFQGWSVWLALGKERVTALLPDASFRLSCCHGDWLLWLLYTWDRERGDEGGLTCHTHTHTQSAINATAHEELWRDVCCVY